MGQTKQRYALFYNKGKGTKQIAHMLTKQIAHMLHLQEHGVTKKWVIISEISKEVGSYSGGGSSGRS